MMVICTGTLHTATSAVYNFAAVNHWLCLLAAYHIISIWWRALSQMVCMWHNVTPTHTKTQLLGKSSTLKGPPVRHVSWLPAF